MKTKMFSTLFASVCLMASLHGHTQVKPLTHEGGVGGGGGADEEAKFHSIRKEIKSWIEKGGSKGLVFPEGMAREDYDKFMLQYLAPNYVAVAFVENDHSEDPELQVSVDGLPKTCRGYFAQKDHSPRVICNLTRFNNTPEAGQYRLIHHEFAGLANLEKNEGAASDYVISDQLTAHLEEAVYSRLVLKVFDRKKINDELNKIQNDGLSSLPAGLVKFAQVVDKFFIADRFVRLSQPKRSLDAEEKIQVKLLSCIQKTIKNARGGFDAPEIAGRFLSQVAGVTSDGKLVFINNPKKIQQVASECEKMRKGLKGFGYFDETKMIDAITKTEFHERVKLVLLSFAQPRMVGCVVRSASVAAGFIITVGGGLGVVSCALTDGTIKNFVGPFLKMGMGFGALVSLDNKEESLFQGEDNDTLFKNIENSSADSALIIGTNHNTDKGYINTSVQDSTSVNVGFGLLLSQQFGMAVRTFNSFRRWDLVLDSFKVPIVRD